MTLRGFFIVSAAVLGSVAFLQAQQPNSEYQKTQPTFKEHRVGESAQEFFSIAKMAEKGGMLSTDYCRSYLEDPKVMKAIEKTKRKGWADQSLLIATMDVEGCNKIRAALAGKDTEIDLRFASEFGTGVAQFVTGHLGSVNFVVKVPFNDVVEDMTSKMKSAPQLSVETLQNEVGAIVKQRRAAWKLPNTVVKVIELHSLDGSSIETGVSVSDLELMKRRPNSLN
jgi:hypothetical protein